MLEKYKQSQRPEFRVYMRETSAFVPWFYQEIKGETRKEMIEKYAHEIAAEKLARQ